MKKNWNNLRENKCPRCGRDFLQHGTYDPAEKTLTCICKFKISTQRMQEIINQINSRDVLQTHPRTTRRL